MAAAQASGTETPMGKRAAEIYENFVADGQGGLDFSGIIRTLGKPD